MCFGFSEEEFRKLLLGIELRGGVGSTNSPKKRGTCLGLLDV